MTEKYENIFINETSLVGGPYEKKGPLKKYFDKTYDDLYFKEETFEKAESHLAKESMEILLKKSNLTKENIDLIIAGDLLNQLSSSHYAFAEAQIPFIGVYSACATSVLSLIIGANILKNSDNKNIICTTSSHNNSAEKQFRYPIEYGAPKKESSTFTVTAGVSTLISKKKSNVKIESSTLGQIIDSKQKDVNNMGAVMAISAAHTIYKHLIDTRRKIDYYDLIITGDLGKYGKEILKEYLKKNYNIELKNYEDAGMKIFSSKEVKAGASGPPCLPIFSYGKILKEKKHKKILLVATGALMSQTMNNQKLSIPSISHAISLEVEP